MDPAEGVPEVTEPARLPQTHAQRARGVFSDPPPGQEVGTGAQGRGQDAHSTRDTAQSRHGWESAARCPHSLGNARLGLEEEGRKKFSRELQFGAGMEVVLLPHLVVFLLDKAICLLSRDVAAELEVAVRIESRSFSGENRLPPSNGPILQLQSWCSTRCEEAAGLYSGEL